MKRLHHILFLCLLLFVLVIPAQAQDQATWTFMVYIAADNDLEPFAINDLMEMQGIGSSDEVNIVVQVDRASGYEEIHGDWTDTRRYYVTEATSNVSSGDFTISQEGFVNVLRQYSPADFELSQEEYDAELAAIAQASREEFEPITMGFIAMPGGPAPAVGLQLVSEEQLGEINTGDPDQLVDFATWAIANYPAENYGLVLWDHGGGWIMIASDESTSDHDSLNLPEIRQALDTIILETGIDKFDFIGFDACLMSQIEVYEAMAPYAEYAIAAQETIPGAGWEYATPLAALVSNPNMTVPEFGEILVDSYITYYSEVLTGYPGFDLNVMDLSKTDAVIAALDNFAFAVQSNPSEVLRAIGNARSNVQVFNNTSPDDADYMSSVDLIHFMELLSTLSTDANVSAAAQNVIAAAADMRVYGRANDGLPDANGLAIYFPRNVNIFNSEGLSTRYPIETPAGMASWLSFLNTFHGTATDTFKAADLTMTITNLEPVDGVSSIHNPPIIEFETNGQGIVEVSFVAALELDDGTQIILDLSPLESAVVSEDGESIDIFTDGVSLSEFSWNVEMPVINDGVEFVPTVLLSNPDQPDNVLVSGIFVSSSNGNEKEAFLIFDIETRKVTSVWGIEESSNGSSSAEIRTRPGDQFIPTWRFLDENGDLDIVSSGTPLTFSGQSFTYDFEPAIDGQYALTMLVEDMAGNISTDTTLIIVDNEGLDTNYRGFKDLDFGINFLYPWDWADPTVIEAEDGSISIVVSDLDGNISIYVNAYDTGSLDDMLAVAYENIEGFGGVAYEAVEFTVGGYDAYIVEYDYASVDDVPFVGAMMVVYVPESASGYIVDVDAPEDMLDAGLEAFNTVAETMGFFEPRQE